PIDLASEEGRRFADIAASAQRVLENILVDIARALHRETGLDDLCFGGGVALNGVANTRLLNESGFARLYVPPAPGDAGCALGAALYADRIIFGHRHQPVPDHPFWGPEIDPTALARLSAEDGFACEQLTDNALLADLAERLAQGQIVGWMDGATEF